VSADVDLEVRALPAIDPPRGPGWLVTNPPYGVRVSEARAVRDLYATIGKVVRGKCAGWTVAMLSPDERLERQVGLSFVERFRTVNGGIHVRLVTGKVPG
jgi:putative N6-adenine-specific DNA methylase